MTPLEARDRLAGLYVDASRNHATWVSRSRTWVPVCASVALYVGVSVLANWSSWTHGISHSIQTSGGADVHEEIWFLAQTPWSIVHGVNPFVNSLINAPTGINLMDNTSMMLLGILGAPITFLFGPLATFNVLLDIGFATSASAFYFLARRFVTWEPAAFVSGLLYGFSPFALAEGNGHLFLIFNAVPPLLLLAADCAFRTGSISLWRGGVYFGLLLIAQFFISTEMFASLAVVILLALLLFGLYAVWTRWSLDSGRIVQFVASASLVCVLGIGYGAWIAVEGPHHIVGPAQSPTALAGLSSDPAALVIPTINQRFTFGKAAIGDQLVAVRDQNWKIANDDAAENGSYVGVTLLAGLIIGAIALRRRPLVLFCTAMAIGATVMSMGSHLHVYGHRTHIPLPFIVLAHLPLLKSSVAARYSLFFWLFAALLMAVAVDALFDRAHQYRWIRGRSMRQLFCWAVIAAVLLPLTPSWPYSAARWTTPKWFLSGARRLSVGTGVLVYPIASSADASAMAWQAEAHLTFHMPGGYAIFASPSGVASFNSAPSITQEALALCAEDQRLDVAPEVIRAQLATWRVNEVVVPATAPGSSCARALLQRTLGEPALQQQVMIWVINTPAETRPGKVRGS